MLTEFHLQNFKALADATFSLGKINVFIGPNSSGKSSVLQALAVLKQSVGENHLVTSGSLVDLGAFDDILYAGAILDFIDLSLEFDRDATYANGRRRALTYKLSADIHGILHHEVHIHGWQGELSGTWDRYDSDSRSYVQSWVKNDSVWQETSGIVGNLFRFDCGNSDTESVIPEAITELRKTAEMLSSRLDRVFVVPALRGFERTVYPFQSEPSEDFFGIADGDAQASAVLSTILYRRELEDQISDFSERTLGVRLRVRAVPGGKVSAEVVSSDRSTKNIVNEGFGVNQLMMLLAQMVSVPRDSILGVEEPEIHLHPKAQLALANVFTDIALRQDKQIIVTTHSEHILMSLLTLVARGDLPHDDLKVYYFEKDEKGVSHPELLEVNERGQLKGGLKGFFEVNLDQMDNYLGAMSKRKRK